MRLVALSCAIAILVPFAFGLDPHTANANSGPPIIVSTVVPSELNPPFIDGTRGGAPSATPEQGAAFAWQEFIALNWPAGPQSGREDQRDSPSSWCSFSDPRCSGPTVWETFRGKVEIFPGVGAPPGYPGVSGDASFGYDALPQYNYDAAIPACDPKQANEPVPWVNLDETDQIGLDNMYAGTVRSSVSPGNSAPQLIRFLAKGNRSVYVYVARNSSPTDQAEQWWYNVPTDVVTATKAYLAEHMASPPAGSATLVSLPYGTIEMKAGWRPLNPSEIASGRFHSRRVRFYEPQKDDPTVNCYRNATWGLVALHVIQKTPSAPYFIYATFEQADNIKTINGKPIEDADGNLIVREPAIATTPQECLIDPRPPAGASDETPSTLGSVILTSNTATCEPVKVQQYCDNPGHRLYYRNEASAQMVPSAGNICVDKRDNDIPEYVINANEKAHASIDHYLSDQGIPTSPWLYYKLVNVQYYPYDKIITTPTPNGSLYKGIPPFTAQNPAASSYYLSNIVVETNRSLQLFSGSLSPQATTAAVVTNWNADGTQHKAVIYGGQSYDMGGCMGCHGAQGQNRPNSAGDFSVILGKGHVKAPEIPSLPTPTGMTQVERNQGP